MSEEGIWVRYKHKLNGAIEYDVFHYWSQPIGGAISQKFKGEWCFRIRTVRNIALPEEVHQTAYTMMPADKFHEVYERATSEVAA